MDVMWSRFCDRRGPRNGPSISTTKAVHWCEVWFYRNKNLVFKNIVQVS